MKVKILSAWDSLSLPNEIVDALENPINEGEIVVFDKYGRTVMLTDSQWEMLDEHEIVQEETAKKETLSERVATLRDIFGQDMQSITFK